MNLQDRIDQLVAEIADCESQIALLQRRIDEAKRELGTLDVSWMTWKPLGETIYAGAVLYYEDGTARVIKFTDDDYEVLNLEDLPVELQEFDQEE